jgi:TonB family protein
MNLEKISVMLFLIVLFFFGCTGKKSEIELVPNLESIYLPISQVDVPPNTENGFNTKAGNDLVDALKSVIDRKIQIPILYKIKVRLFINEQGKIEKLKDMGTTWEYPNSGGSFHFISVEGLDNAISSTIGDWQFTPAIKDGKPVKLWTDLNVDIHILPDGTYKKFELPAFLSNVPDINDFVHVETMPSVINPVPPEYPKDAKQSGVEGTAFVKVLVGRDGKPLKAVVVRSNNEIFNQPSVDAAMKFKFSAASNGNLAVPVWVVIPFKFKLDK